MGKKSPPGAPPHIRKLGFPPPHIRKFELVFPFPFPLRISHRNMTPTPSKRTIRTIKREDVQLFRLLNSMHRYIKRPSPANRRKPVGKYFKISLIYYEQLKILVRT